MKKIQSRVNTTQSRGGTTQNPPRPKKDENGLYPCPCGAPVGIHEPGEWDNKWRAECRASENVCNNGPIYRATRESAIRAANEWVSVYWGKEAK